MRHVPHPIAIVTAAPTQATTGKTNASHWRGATISSFVTVALDPEPVVCFNIKHDSSTFAALAQSSQFNVHLLRSSPEAEVIATKFASGNALEPFHDGEGELEWWVRQPAAAEGSAPVIVGSKNEVEAEGTARDSVVSFRLSCSHLADKTVAVGDHVVVFGKVVDVDHGLEETEGTSRLAAPCLLYVEGGYSRIASK
jgi:flavin reductase (DIM6/NTAB) family NADH-FMN oxidoreductase RutF